MTSQPSPGGPLPAHLSGVVPVSLGRRFVARLADFGVTVVALAVPWGILFAAGFPQPIPIWVFVLAVLLMMVISFLPLVLVIATGWMPGGYLTGVRQIKMSTGTRPGFAALVKYLVFQVISSATFTIGALVIWFKTRDGLGRCWHDRFADILVIDTRQGRDPIADPVPPSAPPRMVPGLVGPGVPGQQGVPQPQAQPFPPASQPFASPPQPFAPAPQPHAPAPEAFAPAGEAPWLAPQPSAPSPVPFQPAQAGFAPPPAPAAVPPAGDQSALTLPSGGTGVGEDATISKIPPGSVRLTFDDGTVRYVRTSVVIGRDPVPDAEHPGAQRVPVRDPERTISKTHAVLTVHGDSVVVEDLNSTNGTVVVAPNGERSAALPGTPIWAGAGSTVEFGERSVRIGA
ncbi:MAG: RDD family protein [Propionibacteriaceae bacterium]|nr:RDD family protein [Propionibacteriaceae bacterium]